ncbi:hypothetical protein JCM24511_08478 [Saitozyma sp. JCM 24511]|nr:hypothetical protein JCM24511_08478 [Saitozyma sp. JCM 24511]
MNMLWNNQVADTCVVFRSWHIHGWATMLLILITLISIFYAYLLHTLRRLDKTLALTLLADSRGGASGRREQGVASISGSGGAGVGGSTAGTGLIPPIPGGYQAIESSAGRAGVVKLSLHARVKRAGLYALTVALSFWLMLVAMTYNTYLFSSIVLGSFLGHMMYEGEIDLGTVLAGGGKGLACH